MEETKNHCQSEVIIADDVISEFILEACDNEINRVITELQNP